MVSPIKSSDPLDPPQAEAFFGFDGHILAKTADPLIPL